MQVYVNKAGQQFGPYTVEEVRRYVEAGNFAPTDYACCDGANWVTVAEIPGYAPKAESMPHAGREKPAGKSRKGIYLIAGIAALLITASALGIYFLLGEDEPVAKVSPPATVEKSPEPPAPAEKPPEPSVEPDVFDLTPEALVDVYDGDTFKVDLAGVHPLFGDDVPIRVSGIDTPEIRGVEDRVKELGFEARDLAEKLLRGAERIELRNPQRGKYFRIVAEVYLDGESLAEKLKSAGLAKDYDGEGERPEW